jgi:hypothetical protein
MKLGKHASLPPSVWSLALQHYTTTAMPTVSTSYIEEFEKFDNTFSRFATTGLPRQIPCRITPDSQVIAPQERFKVSLGML